MWNKKTTAEQKKKNLEYTYHIIAILQITFSILFFFNQKFIFKSFSFRVFV